MAWTDADRVAGSLCHQLSLNLLLAGEFESSDSADIEVAPHCRPRWIAGSQCGGHRTAPTYSPTDTAAHSLARCLHARLFVPDERTTATQANGIMGARPLPHGSDWRRALVPRVPKSICWNSASFRATKRCGRWAVRSRQRGCARPSPLEHPSGCQLHASSGKRAVLRSPRAQGRHGGRSHGRVLTSSNSRAERG